MKPNMPNPPEKFRCKIAAIEHKIGLHNLVYMLIGGEWVRSTKKPQELINIFIKELK